MTKTLLLLSGSFPYFRIVKGTTTAKHQHVYSEHTVNVSPLGLFGPKEKCWQCVLGIIQRIFLCSKHHQLNSSHLNTMVSMCQQKSDTDIKPQPTKSQSICMLEVSETFFFGRNAAAGLAICSGLCCGWRKGWRKQGERMDPQVYVGYEILGKEASYMDTQTTVFIFPPSLLLFSACKGRMWLLVFVAFVLPLLHLDWIAGKHTHEYHIPFLPYSANRSL